MLNFVCAIVECNARSDSIRYPVTIGHWYPSLSMTAWILNIILNVSVTVVIATHLWRLGRNFAHGAPSHV